MLSELAVADWCAVEKSSSDQWSLKCPNMATVQRINTSDWGKNMTWTPASLYMFSSTFNKDLTAECLLGWKKFITINLKIKFPQTCAEPVTTAPLWGPGKHLSITAARWAQPQHDCLRSLSFRNTETKLSHSSCSLQEHTETTVDLIIYKKQYWAGGGGNILRNDLRLREENSEDHVLFL